MFRRYRRESQKESRSYVLSYNDIRTQKPIILLNSEIFKHIKPDDIIEISFLCNTDIKIIFKLKSENFPDNCEKTISINEYLLNLITKEYKFNPIKEKIYIQKIKKQNMENYVLSKISIQLKEYIPRSELFKITLNMLNETVIKGQEIYNKDNNLIGIISDLSNNSFSGLINFSTNYNLGSLSSDIYLMFDISKSSYYYTSYFYVNYEVIIDYVKNLLLKLKSENTYHNIYIIFYIRIYFKSNKDYKKIYNFVKKEPFEDNTYYFDLYDKIETFNIENFQVSEILYRMNKVYQIYEKIKSYVYQKQNFQNLNQFLFFIRDHLQYPLPEDEQKYLYINKDILSYSFEGYESSNDFSKKNSECSFLDNNIFNDVEEFEISGFNQIPIFESLFFAISLIENNKKNKIKKYNPLVNIVLSGESFPYYCEALSDKVKSSINEQYMHLIFTYLCPKNGVSGKKNSEYYQKINIKRTIDNEDYLKFDNFYCEIPPWCKIYYVPHTSLYKNLEKYKEKYRNKTNKNSVKFHKLEEFDKKFKLDILNLDLEPNIQKLNEDALILKSNNYNFNKSKENLTLDDIMQIYSTKKSLQNKNKENQINSIINEEIELSRYYSINENSFNFDIKTEAVNLNYMNSQKIKNNQNLENNNYDENGIDELEKLFIHVPVPFFIEYAKNMRIDPKIIKCYSTKKDKNLIFKRIDHNFNLIIENEKDETLKDIQNMLSNKSNDVIEKFLMTNKKIVNVLEFKTYQTDVLQYNIKRNMLYFNYYYIVANSINGSVFKKTNNQVKKIDFQEMDNNLND